MSTICFLGLLFFWPNAKLTRSESASHITLEDHSDSEVSATSKRHRV